MGKGSRRRLQQIADEQMQENWDTIFNKKKVDYKEVQQDLTELNGDGNRTRGRYGEDYDKSNPSV